MIFKCKICGGELNIQKGQSIVECEYCGVKQTLPRFLDENIKLMYDRANSYLLHNEFDKAENIYNQILLADKEDAEAYWNLVLCKYGVTYVKDPASGKYIPTCNRTHYASVFNDENYQSAIKYANAEKAELYKQDAKTIDDIQRGILSISKHEKPFDIFISYKETGENGARTKDSIKAQELYDKLTAESYKVFFSRITLEDKIGTEYEPYIYAALASSKIMLVIGSSKENLEAVWVKNEWSRYLSFTQRDSEKTLIPLYFDMDKADLPEEFVHLTAYDMTVDGFEQELIRGIKKLIPLPIMQAERRKKFRRKLKVAGVAVLVLAVIGGIASVPWFMKLPDYNAAMQLYYDKNYPEAAWAFADLGSYRDSEKMKDKCERSWRNSLATVTAMLGRNNYYITPTGEVTSDGNDDLIQDLNISNRGTFTSIQEGGASYEESGKEFSYTYHRWDYLYINALYEDGHIVHSYSISEYDNESAEQATNISYGTTDYDTTQWHDIIQTVETSDAITIALRADGSVLFQSHYDKVNPDMMQLNELLTWENIVSLQCECYGGISYGVIDIIIGVKADGTVCYVCYERFDPDVVDEGFFHLDDTFDILDQLNNVTKIDVSFDTANSNYNSGVYTYDLYLNIAVLTKDGNLLTYLNGVYNTCEAKEAIDIEITTVTDMTSTDSIPAVRYLNTSGSVIELSSGKVCLKDVVHIERSGLYDLSYITRNGFAIFSDPQGETDKKNKVMVYDEWIERMN